MNKRLPEKESFFFARTAASGQIITLRLTIWHRTSGPIVIERTDSCANIISGEPVDVNLMVEMMTEISEFAKYRIAQAEAITIDEA